MWSCFVCFVRSQFNVIDFLRVLPTLKGLGVGAWGELSFFQAGPCNQEAITLKITLQPIVIGSDSLNLDSFIHSAAKCEAMTTSCQNFTLRKPFLLQRLLGDLCATYTRTEKVALFHLLSQFSNQLTNCMDN